MSSRSRTKITKRIVDALEPRQTIWDSEIRGFGVRRQVLERSFIIKARQNGRQKFITIGKHGSTLTVEEARKKAIVALARMQSGGELADPMAEQTTVDAICTRYLREHALPHKKPRSAESDRQIIRNHISPLLGNRPITSLARSDIEQFRNDVFAGKTAPKNPRAQQLLQKGGRPVRGGPGVANRALALLSKIMNITEDWGVRPQNTNPVRRIKKYREQSKERFLTDVELGRLGVAISTLLGRDEISPFVASIIRLLLLTGARVSEMQTLKWEFVDFHRRVITLPDSKTGRKTIRLSTPALAILHGLPRLHNNPHVFPGQKNAKPVVNLRKPWKRICTLAELADVRLHDLRHTFASVAAMQGNSLLTIGALLGHGSASTTARYAHLQNDHISEANQTTANAIATSLFGANN